MPDLFFLEDPSPPSPHPRSDSLFHVSDSFRDDELYFEEFPPNVKLTQMTLSPTYSEMNHGDLQGNVLKKKKKEFPTKRKEREKKKSQLEVN